MNCKHCGKAISDSDTICPACGNDSVYAPSNPYRPFCSARCKGVDLGAEKSLEPEKACRG